LVIKPEEFEVIVATNMNGDIISDLTSGLIGGLGFAPSANIGDDVAIFEAVHGSAPDIAGKDIANPTALILTATLMLRHIRELEAARTIENALLYVLERGEVTTRDVRKSGAKVVGTSEFADCVIKAFGKIPDRGAVLKLTPFSIPTVDAKSLSEKAPKGVLVGVDIFVDSLLSPQELGTKLELAASDSQFFLKMMSNRGTQVYPTMGPGTACVDHYRCRFILRDNSDNTSGKTDVSDEAITKLLHAISRDTALGGAGIRWMHLEKLITLDGEKGYTLAQGES
jgi:isocitrate dehydrogenase